MEEFFFEDPPPHPWKFQLNFMQCSKCFSPRNPLPPPPPPRLRPPTPRNRDRELTNRRLLRDSAVRFRDMLTVHAFLSTCQLRAKVDDVGESALPNSSFSPNSPTFWGSFSWIKFIHSYHFIKNLGEISSESPLSPNSSFSPNSPTVGGPSS